MRLAATTLFLLIPLPVQAGYGSAYDIYPMQGDVFEVVAKTSPGDGTFWCGAGQHAIADLNRDATQRIYVARGRDASTAQPGRRSVVFSFTPPTPDPVQSQSISVDLVGNAMSAAQAQAHCYDRTIKD
ncbi:hypothetical protein FGK63_15300 [Ruegeria sediminis]|uniref:Secreted protein n=1 Tax=Ruegeria sediminis TaxID=2583820 RepID=A0ABY2WV66_9RHOB|nr:hypothetical protein [Ruegeria sediminis]TMV06505.1 hypothetical protein FGK63_15300 [Ruegeria sediminis]